MPYRSTLTSDAVCGAYLLRSLACPAGFEPTFICLEGKGTSNYTTDIGGNPPTRTETAFTLDSFQDYWATVTPDFLDSQIYWLVNFSQTFYKSIKTFDLRNVVTLTDNINITFAPETFWTTNYHRFFCEQPQL